MRHLGTDGHEIGWDMIRAVSASKARYAISPLQDVLGLGSEARMNRPGIAEGQWTWRFGWDAIEELHTRRLVEIGAAHRRTSPAISIGGPG